MTVTELIRLLQLTHDEGVVSDELLRELIRAAITEIHRLNAVISDQKKQIDKWNYEHNETYARRCGAVKEVF